MEEGNIMESEDAGSVEVQVFVNGGWVGTQRFRVVPLLEHPQLEQWMCEGFDEEDFTVVFEDFWRMSKEIQTASLGSPPQGSSPTHPF